MKSMKVMKEKRLNNIHCKTVEKLIERLAPALCDFFDHPQQVKKP